MIEDGYTDYEIQKSYPNLFASSFKGIAEMRKNKREHDAGIQLMEDFCNVDLREWQVIAFTLLKEQSNREVLWFVDYLGGSGKTWFAKYLVAMHDAFYCTGGKAADIAHAYNFEKMVVFDFTRSKKEIVNYNVIEKMKDGIIFSPKYQSTNKQFAPCTVVCFSNWDPDKNKLSLDRWNINYLFKGQDEWKLRADNGDDLYSVLDPSGFVFDDDEGMMPALQRHNVEMVTPPPSPYSQRQGAIIIDEEEEDDEKKDHL